MEATPMPLKPMQTLEKNLTEGPSQKGFADYAVAAKAWVAEKVTFCKHRAKDSAKVAKDKVVEVASDKSTQVAAASAAGGAVVGGTGGAIAGLFVGGTIGAAVGVIPAFLTFGLSIPLGAALGSGCGVVVGSTVGGATGLAGAGAAGYGAYTRREEIGKMVDKAQTKSTEVIGRTRGEVESRAVATKARIVGAYSTVKDHCASHVTSASEKAASACGVAKEALETTKTKTMELASDKSVQVTAASAAGGAVTMGAGGGATGLVTGGAIGAAVGVVPAIFTFGLSIPICAMVGGSCGLVTGTAVGGTAGLVGGGATGYGIYTKRKAISSSVSKTISRVDDCAKYMKDAASSSADYVRARVVSGTGGTTH